MLLQECALITDGRFSGGSHGFVIGHVAPEAQEGGPLALVTAPMPTTSFSPSSLLPMHLWRQRNVNTAAAALYRISAAHW